MPKSLGHFSGEDFIPNSLLVKNDLSIGYAELCRQRGLIFLLFYFITTVLVLSDNRCIKIAGMSW